jgi:hypothetical protein
MGYYNLFDFANCKHFRFAQWIIDSPIPGFVCGWVIEDAIHFFLECCLYVEAREQLANNLQFLDSLLIETLLFGDDSLQNCHIRGGNSTMEKMFTKENS